MEITKVGIVGCGTMGAGIALSCARSGYTTLVLELSQQLLNRGFEDIGARLDADISSGLMAAQEKEGVLNNLAGTLEICDLAGCDIVIEAAPEKIELKQELLKKLEGVISTKCVLATNTSSLPIINIASVLEHPERVVGLHFCHPAHIRELVELISSIRTSTDVTETAYEFATSLGKTVIRAKDQPGFILNYLQYPFRLNAIRMVERGMATPEDIDLAARLGLGHPMGPLEFQDMTGLDVTYNACKAIYEATRDPAFAPPVLMQQMVAANLLGRKTGRGFYDYTTSTMSGK